MLFPMMGLLFSLAIFGIIFGLITIPLKKLRRYSAYLAFPAMLAALCSFLGFWGGGFLIEKVFGTNHWSGFVITIGGYAGGLCFGAILGLYLAKKTNARFYK